MQICRLKKTLLCLKYIYILIDSVTDLVPATVQLGGPAGGKEMVKGNQKREANQLGRG